MPKLRKLTALGLAVLLIAAIFTPIGAPTAEAQLVVFEPGLNVSTILHYIGRLIEIIQKYVGIANQYRQIANEYLQLYNQLQQIYNQVLALTKLESPESLSDLDGILMLVIQIMDSTEALHYAVPTLDQQFRELFPGWQVIRDGLTQHKTVAHRHLETTRGILAGLKRNMNNLGSRNHEFMGIKAALKNSLGHEQTLEIGAAATAAVGEELLMLRQLQGMALNLTTIDQATRVSREAETAATWEAALAEMAAADSVVGIAFEPTPTP